MVKSVSGTARSRDIADDAPATGDRVPAYPDHHEPMRELRCGDYYCPREIAEEVYCKRKVKGQ
jgi:hypothetical protein